MFTGIIEKKGSILITRDESYGKSIIVQCSAWDSPIQRGESISISGCCLTVIEHEELGNELKLTFDVIPETLRMTTLNSWISGECVNVERAVTAGTPLGGHIVQGHVDYVSTVMDIKKTNGAHVLELEVPTGMELKIVEKGCISVNGISLTISDIQGEFFSVSLIPETLEMTNLNNLSIGNKVNLETDVMTRSIASIVEKMLTSKQRV